MDPSIRKLLTNEVVNAQLKIINEDLQPPNLHNKEFFIGFGQLCMDIGYQLKRNLDVKEMMLSGKQLTKRNTDEFELLWEKKERIVQNAARNKCLNIRLDLWDMNGLSVLGMNGSHWKNDFCKPP